MTSMSYVLYSKVDVNSYKLSKWHHEARCMNCLDGYTLDIFIFVGVEILMFSMMTANLFSIAKLTITTVFRRKNDLLSIDIMYTDIYI